MTLLQPTIFDDALHGPPVQSLVVPQSLWDDLQGWWEVRPTEWCNSG